VYLPEGVSPAKRERLEASGARLAFAPNGGIAEIRARADAQASGKVYVSPYNDEKVGWPL
jgi:threonine dehydratase